MEPWQLSVSFFQLLLWGSQPLQELLDERSVRRSGCCGLQVDAAQLAGGVTALTREVERVSKHGMGMLLFLCTIGMSVCKGPN